MTPRGFIPVNDQATLRDAQSRGIPSPSFFGLAMQAEQPRELFLIDGFRCGERLSRGSLDVQIRMDGGLRNQYAERVDFHLDGDTGLPYWNPKLGLVIGHGGRIELTLLFQI